MIQNKYLTIEINPCSTSDIKRLNALEMDIKYLVAQIKHNAYNPQEMARQSVEARQKNFLQVMVKYATAKPDLGAAEGEAKAAAEEEQKKADAVSSNSDSVGSQTRRGFYASETETELEPDKRDGDPYGLQQQAGSMENGIANRGFNTEHKTRMSRKNNATFIGKKPTKAPNFDDNLVQQKYSGANAIMNSMHKYKSSLRSAQVQEANQSVINNPLVQYYMVVEQSQMFPKAMGLVHRTKPTTLIDCSNQYMRKDYVLAVSKALRVAQFVSELNLRNTHLGTYGAIQLVENVNRSTLKRLDVSYNPMIKVEFYERLADVVNDSSSRLQVLELEANKMGDAILEVLCTWLKESPYIRIINLSKNEITDKGVPSIVSLID